MMEVSYTQWADFEAKRDTLEHGKFHAVQSSVSSTKCWKVSFKSHGLLTTIKTNITKKQAEKMAIALNQLIEI
ncbi:hypothetical protein PN480_03275 [Dolichospermum circinale CS-1225]|uniref:hypothetical protein n=1 Tax=Dolichospermum circinale TaxID=109265 RepID=UPI0023305BD7|nr:hypothetical protein [Dolichospermum circinale]MDB9520977.1 hypothetical protein [Dolichospermum circinale CS-1225]